MATSLETLQSRSVALHGQATDEVLKHTLIASGPVPWNLKTVLYRRLVTDARWHYYIYQSLLHSAFDVYGNLDRSEAVDWLNRLLLPKDTPDLAELVAHLRRR